MLFAAEKIYGHKKAHEKEYAKSDELFCPYVRGAEKMAALSAPKVPAKNAPTVLQAYKLAWFGC